MAKIDLGRVVPESPLGTVLYTTSTEDPSVIYGGEWSQSLSWVTYDETGKPVSVYCWERTK